MIRSEKENSQDFRNTIILYWLKNWIRWYGFYFPIYYNNGYYFTYFELRQSFYVSTWIIIEYESNVIGFRSSNLPVLT